MEQRKKLEPIVQLFISPRTFDAILVDYETQSVVCAGKVNDCLSGLSRVTADRIQILKEDAEIINGYVQMFNDAKQKGIVKESIE